jgi:outer membrane protein insertion porin family
MIVDLRIVGNETTPEEDILALIRTRKDRYFDPQALEADVKRLANKGKFRDVRTHTQYVEGGVIVTFEVFEVPTIRYIKFLGNRGYFDKRLLKESGLKRNDPLNRYTVEEGRRKVEEYYRSKGYAKAQVFIIEGDQPQDHGVVYGISEGGLERIYDTSFVGNSFVSGERLKTLIKTKPKFWLYKGVVDRGQIEEDLDRLTSYYRSFGFFGARIGRELKFGSSGKWLSLVFVIDEGPRYVVRNVTVSGNKKFASESLMSQVELTSGQYFDLGKMNTDVNSLRDAYGTVGHIFCEVKADPRFLESPGQLDVVYNIEEGDLFRVGKINVHIDGEYPHTRNTVILNRLSVFPGDLANVREVRDSERRMKASQLFETNVATGQAPRIVIQSPDLSEIEKMAKPPSGKVRGQSPDSYWRP